MPDTTAPPSGSFLEFLDKIFDRLPLILIGLDLEGKSRYWSQGAEQITGYSQAEVLAIQPGTPFLISNPSDFKDIMSKLQSGQGFSALEVEITCKNGSQRTITWYTTGRMAEGDVVNWVIGMDITAERKIEEELRQKVNELEIMNNALHDRELKMVKLKEEIEIIQHQMQTREEMLRSFTTYSA